MADTDSMSSTLPGKGEIQVALIVFVVTLLMVKVVTMMKKKRYNLPPGPWGLPLVGYLPFFGPHPHLTFNQMRKKYGDVIGIRMGSWPAIVIHGSDAIKEALVTNGDHFSGRPAFTTGQLLNNGKSLIFSLHGAIWKTQRKIVNGVLYTFSNARKSPIEDIIRSDAKVVIEDFLSHGDNSFRPFEQLETSGYSLIYQLCFGRLQNIREDPGFMEFIEQMRNFQNFTRAGNPVDVMPWLRYIMPWKISKFLEQIKHGQQIRKKKVEEHESSFHKSTLRDITDGLLDAANHLTEEEQALGLDKKQVIGGLGSLFGAGGSTVSTVFKWFPAMMTAFPDAQEEVYLQISKVVGQGRDVTLADRAQLPLVEATIYEIIRYTGAIPFTIPHCTTCDTNLQRYDIPEGTVVMVNLYSLYMDDKLWGDPEVFRPQRFLDTEGQLDRAKLEQMAFFSLGRRRCLGENVARMELFLFFASLMQRLQFCKPPGVCEVVLNSRFGLTVDVEPFDVCVKQRE